VASFERDGKKSIFRSEPERGEEYRIVHIGFIELLCSACEKDYSCGKKKKAEKHPIISEFIVQFIG